MRQPGRASNGPSASEALLTLYVLRSRNEGSPGVAIVIPDDKYRRSAEALVDGCREIQHESDAVIIVRVDPSLTTGGRLDDGRYVLLHGTP